MLASELIIALQKEIEKKGDLPLRLHGPYGAESDDVEVASEEWLNGAKRYFYIDKHIHLLTSLFTG